MKLTEEQERKLKEIAPGESRTFNRMRDKVFHEQLQEIDADLDGVSYMTNDSLFRNCDTETIDALLSGSVNDLLGIEKPVEKEKNEGREELNSLLSILSEELIDEDDN